MANQIITKITLTRPSEAVAFSAQNARWTRYLQTTYIETGKILSREVTVSEDKLTRYITTVWPDEETRQQYLNDPVTVFALKEEKGYRQATGIGFQWENVEMDGDNVVRSWSGGETDY